MRLLFPCVNARAVVDPGWSIKDGGALQWMDGCAVSGGARDGEYYLLYWAQLLQLRPSRVSVYLFLVSEHWGKGIGYLMESIRALCDLKIELPETEVPAHEAPLRVVEGHHASKRVVIGADLKRGALDVRAEG